jgi:hypothetical protein
MRKGFLIYEEMRKYLVIVFEEAVNHIRLCNCSFLNFLIYEENLISFLSVLEHHNNNWNTPWKNQITLWQPKLRPASITKQWQFQQQQPVLQIHDILVRIRIRGSMPLTYRSGSCYFRHWPWRYIYIIFKDKRSKKSHKAVRIKVVLTIFAWW